MQKTIISLIICVALVAGGWYLISSNKEDSSPVSEPVAIVNGEKLSRSDLESAELKLALEQGLDVSIIDEATRSQLEKQALDIIISRTLLIQAASSKGIVASETDINTLMETTRGQFENQEAFAAALTKEGLTEENLRLEFSKDLAIRAYLAQEIGLGTLTVTDAEIEETYTQAVLGAENAPELSEVREQVKMLVINQKEQALVTSHVETLRMGANVEVLI